jgi:hypothetical protein
MKTEQPIDQLNFAIELIKSKNAVDYQELKSEINQFKEEIYPSTILKNSFSSWISTSIKEPLQFKNLLPSIIGILTQKIISGNSKSVYKNVLGYGAELLVNQLVNKILNKHTP